MMATSARSGVASVVGWLIVAVVLFWAIGFVIGTIRFLLRAALWLILLAVLVGVYVRLKAQD